MKEGNINKIDSGDYYVIDGTKVPKDSANLVFNYTKNEYTLFSKYPRDTFVEGVVEIFKNGKLKYGLFEYDKFTNITLILHNLNSVMGINYELVRNNYNYRENTSNGYFYYYKSIKALDFRALKNIQREEKNRLPYNLSGDYQDQFVEKYNESKLIPREGVKDIVKGIEGLSFGFEFETVNGFIPPRLSGATGLAPLRDGSISGIEYVTVPLEGEKGVEALLQNVEMLEQRTSFDNSCSMHLHIGNIPRTKKFILAMYLLTLFVQDSIFEHFPITKLFNWGTKNKNYTKPYDRYDVLLRLDKSITKDNLKRNFNVLLEKLAMTSNLNDLTLGDITTHPADPNGQHKWQVQTRYSHINFIPLLFVNKQTIEFRIHTPTFNKDKVLAYLVFCAAMINFCKVKQNEILKNYRTFQGMTVDYILRYGTPKLSERVRNSVIHYYRERKNTTQYQNAQGDVRGKESSISGFNIIGDRNTIGRRSYTQKARRVKGTFSSHKKMPGNPFRERTSVYKKQQAYKGGIYGRDIGRKLDEIIEEKKSQVFKKEPSGKWERVVNPLAEAEMYSSMGKAIKEPKIGKSFAEQMIEAERDIDKHRRKIDNSNRHNPWFTSGETTGATSTSSNTDGESDYLPI